MTPGDENYEAPPAPEMPLFEETLASLISSYRKVMKKSDMLDILESATNSLEEDGEE
jgi:hypothetical protein